MVSLWPKAGWIELTLNAKRDMLNDPDDITYDISNRRWTNTQYAIRVYKDTDIEPVKDILMQLYRLYNAR